MEKRELLNSNLIVNGDFEQGNTGFTSGYTYSPGNLEPETTYDVVSNPLLDHPGNPPFPGDHTTGHGLMMAVNGATSANVTVWSETVPVNPNTASAFSFWEANWSPYSPPTLNVLVNGASIGTFPAPSTDGIWTQFQTTWNAGSNASANLKIIDLDTDAFGNDFALDDLSLATIGQPTTTTLTSSLNPSLYGQPVTFTATVTSGSNTVNSGTVTFEDGGTVLAASVPLDSTGHASVPIATLSATSSHLITASYNGTAGFEASAGSISQTVNRAPLIVVAANDSRPYGAANPPLTGAILGIQNNDPITATYSTPATPANNVGSYAILPTLSDGGTGKLSNYAVTSINGTLTIMPAPLTITPANVSRQYGSPNPPLTGAISGVQNGDNITANYRTTATATSPVGTYVITATLNDPGKKLGNYRVMSNQGTLTIAPDPLLVTTIVGSGPGSLRDTVANAPPGGAVHFLAGLSGTIALNGGPLDIVKDMTIAGPGAGLITLSGGATSQVVQIAPGVTVTISGLTIANGHSSGIVGGGIYNQGTLTVHDCTIANNFAGPRGGGIYNSPSGTLTLDDSLVSGNSTTDAGGGVYNVGAMAISTSTLAGNGGTDPDGGAIYNVGTLTIAASTLSSNGGSGAFGGAIRNDGVLSVEESTFAGNAGNLGGAIYNNGTLVINHSTVSGNTATVVGGGIDNNNGVVIARDTLLAGNAAVGGSGPDVYGVLTSLGHNLIGNTSGGSGFVASDVLNVNPLLGPLQYNGGPMQTMALLPGSPAVDAGDNTDPPSYDQRGPGYLRIVGGTIDIGAFEVQLGAASHLQIEAPTPVSSNRPFDVTVTALDAYGHTAVGYRGTIAFGSTDTATGVVLPPRYTFTAIDNGVHVFAGGMTLRTPGSQSIRITDTRTPSIAGSVTVVVAPPVFLVTTTLDSGPGSLRQALLDADATPGPDSIRFDIGTGVQTIQVASPLPPTTQPMILDGTTQPGYAGAPLIELNGAGAGPSADGLLITAGGSLVRGLVINRFALAGIDLQNSGGDIIQGNYIGTDVTGTIALSNGIGIRIATSNNTIGGTVAGTENVISGNLNDGVLIVNGTANVVQGNLFGTDASATLSLGNGNNGVHLLNVSGSAIGGTAGGAANVIADNGHDGVLVDGGSGNAIRENSIFGHSNGLGIELADGGNNNLSFPVLTSAVSDGVTTSVEGLIQSTPNTVFTVEFFANSVCSLSGFGEGQQFLGSSLVTTDSSGTATFSATLASAVPPGQFIAATATDSNGNTSAFSSCIGVDGPTSPPGFGPGMQIASSGASIPSVCAWGSSTPRAASTPLAPSSGWADLLSYRHALDVVFGKRLELGRANSHSLGDATIVAGEFSFLQV